MLDTSRRSSEKQVGKEPVSVGAHRQQVATFLLDPFDDSVTGSPYASSASVGMPIAWNSAFTFCRYSDSSVIS